ncbi:MAG: acetyl-CoA carboxylase biotin carboxyl carrier protein subunit [Burkholderiales bacterium]|nr:acetyl-CoA carboxylase biotin carboxyl carrier protein subunit [Burkholderiales bacterium]
MDALQIKALIDAMASSDLSELEATKDGWTLRLVRGVARGVVRGKAPGSATRPAAPQEAGEQADSGQLEQRASLAGTVFLTPAPGEPAFVQPGQAVKAGQTLCVIEAMKVFNEVSAERDGVVDAFLVTSGQDIDAGQPLLRLRLR